MPRSSAPRTAAITSTAMAALSSWLSWALIRNRGSHSPLSTHQSLVSGATRSLLSTRVPSRRRGSVLLGDKVYFPCEWSTRIVEYNVGEQKLCVIDVPFHVKVHSDLMAAENGMLLFAGVQNSRLYLSSMEAYPCGAVAWAGHRVIELEPLLPRHALLDISVVGFAQGVDVVFLSTEAGLFTIELSSNRSRKVLRKSSFDKVMPYMSFYTGVHRDDFPQAHGGGGGGRSGEVSLAAGGATTI